MPLAVRKEGMAGVRSQHPKQINKMTQIKDLAGSARKVFLALSLGTVGAWLAVGVVLSALFLFAVLGD